MPAKPTKPDATTQSPAEYKVAIDAHAEASHRVATAFAPHAQDTPNMTVRLAAGAILSGVTLTEVAAQNTATITAPSANPRIDRVVIDKTTGAVSVVAGSEGASPSAPAIPAGKLPVAQVLLAVGQTAITNADIADERVGGSGGGVELAQDLLDPGEDTAPSTQAVADELDDARALAMFHAFLAQISAGRASGPIPSGYVHLFLTDELATKTGATYNSAGDYYANQSTTTVQNPSAAAGGSPGDGTSFVDRDVSVTNGVTITHIAIYSNSAFSGTAYIVLSNGSASYTVVVSQAVSHSGGGWQTFALSSPYTVPGSGTYRIGLYSATYGAMGGSSNLRAYKAGALSGTSTLSEDGGAHPALGYVYTTGATDMTLVPTAITAGAAPDLIDIYLLHKAVDAVTLNTDLKARASRDNGSNWSGFATLAEVCQFDANYKVLRGQADLSTLASGTSVKWEITTLNNKSQQVRAVAMLLR